MSKYLASPLLFTLSYFTVFEGRILSIKFSD
jgi:hypothetical protein